MTSTFEDEYQNVVYIVIDVESDGASVAENSMFALGGAAIRVRDKAVLGRFAFNVKVSKNKEVEHRCYDEFWSKFKGTWDALHDNPASRRTVAQGIVGFAQKFKDYNVMFASDCSVYDWKWVDNLLLEHCDTGNIFGYTAMDIYSYAAGAFKKSRKDVWKKIKQLEAAGLVNVDGIKHDHDPYNDALQEACLLVDLIRLNHDEAPALLTPTCVLTAPRPHNSNIYSE